MPRAGPGPDFIEALARGLEVIAASSGRASPPVARRGRRRDAAWPARPPAGSCSRWTSSATSAVADGSGGLPRSRPRVLELGVAYVRSLGLWDVARPHMEALVARTHESCSIAQLDGSDIVYVARVAVPKIVAPARADRHPVPGAADLAGQGAARRAARRRGGARARRAEPVRPHRRAGSRTPPSATPALREVRARGWALTDEQLAPGIRSVAAPLRDGTGRVIAALNVNVARRGDVGGAARRGAPAAAAADGGRDQRRLRPAAVPSRTPVARA